MKLACYIKKNPFWISIWKNLAYFELGRGLYLAPKNGKGKSLLWLARVERAETYRIMLPLLEELFGIGIDNSQSELFILILLT